MLIYLNWNVRFLHFCKSSQISSSFCQRTSCMCVCIRVNLCLCEWACVNLNESVGMKRPHSWNASSSERDTSSPASSSELMSSMQVSSWFKRWRRSILDLEPWDAELLVLSERTRGLYVKGSIFDKRSSDVSCVVCPQGQEDYSRWSKMRILSYKVIKMEKNAFGLISPQTSLVGLIAAIWCERLPLCSDHWK